jgi:[ribosomal protein S5]-alanine N-acetyltransferase
MTIATTNRLHIRYSTLDDTTFIYELLNSPGWLRFIGNRNINNLDAAGAYLEERVMPGYEANGFGLNTVTLLDGTPIGLCGLLKRDTLPDADIGFAFLPEHAGKGYGYESAVAVLDHATAQLGINRILAITDQDNINSIGLLKKLGFVFDKLVLMPGEEVELNCFVKIFTEA